MARKLAAALAAGVLLLTAMPALAVDYAGATWYPASTSNYTVSSRETTYAITYIVVHVAEGSYSGTISWFQNPSAGASSHYVVAKDGRVAQMVLGKDVAWHAGNWEYNTHSIGIEHEGFTAQASTWTDAMYRASAALTRFLADKYGVSLIHRTGVMPASATTQTGIIGHNQVPDPNNPSVGGGAHHHTDPGAYFDWSYYMSLVRGDPVDTTAPVTSAVLGGTLGSNGWYRSAVTTTLSATDAGGSGLASTKYRVDGGGWTTYTAPVSVSGQGAHTVSYYSVDGAGNAEATKSIGFSIDTVAPSSTASFSGTAGSNGWWRSPVQAALAATDATSGASSISYTLDGASGTYSAPLTLSAQGSHSLSYAARDAAGNVESTKTAPTVLIDSVAPATSVAYGTPSFANGGSVYVSGATPFSLSATDATSGVASTAWTWRGATQTYAGSFSLAGSDGPGTLSWGSADRAGNAEPLRSLAVVLDGTPPDVRLDAPPEGSITLTSEAIHLEPRVTDAGSGVARVTFLVDNAPRFVDDTAPYAWDWPAGDEAFGPHVLEIRAGDRLGNEASARRTVTTVPSSPSGLVATLANLGAGGAAGLAEQEAGFAGAVAAEVLDSAQQPRPLPIVGADVGADPASRAYRAGVLVDGEFHGIQGTLPAL